LFYIIKKESVAGVSSLDKLKERMRHLKLGDYYVYDSNKKIMEDFAVDTYVVLERISGNKEEEIVERDPTFTVTYSDASDANGKTHSLQFTRVIDARKYLLNIEKIHGEFFVKIAKSSCPSEREIIRTIPTPVWSYNTPYRVAYKSLLTSYKSIAINFQTPQERDNYVKYINETVTNFRYEVYAVDEDIEPKQIVVEYDLVTNDTKYKQVVMSASVEEARHFFLKEKAAKRICTNIKCKEDSGILTVIGKVDRKFNKDEIFYLGVEVWSSRVHCYSTFFKSETDRNLYCKYVNETVVNYNYTARII
jgi:hypothetical protein